MDAIRTYNNTKCELEMAKTRLNLLMDKKEQLYAKYFPVTQKIKDDVVKGGVADNDKMAKYVYELNEVDIGTGRSLAQEIEYQRAVVDKLKCLPSKSHIWASSRLIFQCMSQRFLFLSCIT